MFLVSCSRYICNSGREFGLKLSLLFVVDKVYIFNTLSMFINNSQKTLYKYSYSYYLQRYQYETYSTPPPNKPYIYMHAGELSDDFRTQLRAAHTRLSLCLALFSTHHPLPGVASYLSHTTTARRSIADRDNVPRVYIRRYFLARIMFWPRFSASR